MFIISKCILSWLFPYN